MKDKELTKRKLIQAVGAVIREQGFDALKISTVAKKAEVDRKLVYRYFGSLNHLIENYIVENDYWLVFAEQLKRLISENNYSDTQTLITDILQNQYKFFSEEKDMQRIILYELSSNSPLMKSIHNTREAMGERFLNATDQHFEGSSVNFRAVSALLVGGIYYTILHTIFNGTTFSNMDISSDTGKAAMLKAIGQIVHWAYEKAAAEKLSSQ